MKNQNSSEARSVPEQKKVTDTEFRTEVKLVEMGKASTETKGIGRGFELGFTPRYG
ncbi:MAG: hypothetical protein ACREFT_11100 [Acetobacteraceae bacterium]